MTLVEALKSLPRVSHLAALQLFTLAGEEAALIENCPGQIASLLIYNHLAQTFGTIGPEAARRGLELYCECVGQAREKPGKHPHIDCLFGILARNETYTVKQIFV